MSSDSITNFCPAESQLPFRLLFHGKMQLLTRFPAEFPRSSTKQYLADHFAVRSACWIQGKETAMRSFVELFFFPIWLAQRKAKTLISKTPSSDCLHPL